MLAVCVQTDPLRKRNQTSQLSNDEAGQGPLDHVALAPHETEKLAPTPLVRSHCLALQFRKLQRLVDHTFSHRFSSLFVTRIFFYPEARVS